MLRYGLISTGWSEQLLMLVDAAGRDSLLAALRAFAQQPGEMDLHKLGDRDRSAPPILLRPVRRAIGMRWAGSRSAGLTWDLTPEEAEIFAELLAGMTEGQRQHLDCWETGQITVTVSWGEYPDDRILTAAG